jgi:glycosyltransferase involved in cell wall biosynthesis
MELWSSGLTCDNSRDWQKNTIIALARRKGWKSQPPPDGFRIVAIICAYNEADVIEHTLHYLTEQGIRAILIDNWSTDGTDLRAQAFLDKGLLRIERFPAVGPSGTFDLHNLLSRVEELATEVEADWVIHHDADEIRESPWGDLTLREGLYQVEREGYNCVNHTCIVFPPTPQSEERGAVVPGVFQYFEFGKRPGHFLQNKAWKKQPGRVKLADSGGHDVSFPGRTVYPLRFLLKHYPIRSREHGLRKVLNERLERINPRERQERGWHTQYDSFRESRKFLRDLPQLNFYDAGRFEVEFMTERLAGIGIVR